MTIIIPREIKIGTHTYTIEFDPNLVADEAKWGLVHYRLGKILISPEHGKSHINITLLHEIIHIVDRLYRCNLDEDNIDRLAQGLGEFMFNNLEITFDWSKIRNENAEAI